MEMVVIEKSIEGKTEKREREALSGTESRRDLPVRFRCGKCWLPVDSISASSGSNVKGGGVSKGEKSRKSRKSRCKKVREKRGKEK